MKEKFQVYLSLIYDNYKIKKCMFSLHPFEHDVYKRYAEIKLSSNWDTLIWDDLSPKQIRINHLVFLAAICNAYSSPMPDAKIIDLYKFTLANEPDNLFDEFLELITKDKLIKMVIQYQEGHYIINRDLSQVGLAPKFSIGYNGITNDVVSEIWKEQYLKVNSAKKNASLREDRANAERDAALYANEPLKAQLIDAQQSLQQVNRHLFTREEIIDEKDRQIAELKAQYYKEIECLKRENHSLIDEKDAEISNLQKQLTNSRQAAIESFIIKILESFKHKRELKTGVRSWLQQIIAQINLSISDTLMKDINSYDDEPINAVGVGLNIDKFYNNGSVTVHEN